MYSFEIFTILVSLGLISGWIIFFVVSDVHLGFVFISGKVLNKDLVTSVVIFMEKYNDINL